MSSNYEDDILKLDNQLCFVLYAASRSMTKLYRPLLDPLGLTYPQYLVLLALWQWRVEAPEKVILVRELCDRLFLDSGTLTPLLKRMEKHGLVTRARSADDERSVVIELTQQAMELKKQAASVPATLLCSSVVPLDEIFPMKKTLEKFLCALNQSEASD